MVNDVSGMKKFSTTDVDEAVRLSGLDWIVERHGIMLDTLVDVASHKAIVRGDTQKVLGVVGKGYEPVQNGIAYSMIDEVVKEYDGEYKFGGSFDGGRKVVLQAKLNKTFSVGKEDKVDMYVTLVNAHDGSSAFKMMVTPIRLFCMNQLNVATKASAQKISIRHTANVMRYVEMGRYAFSSYVTAFDVFSETAERMNQKFVDTAMVNKFLDGVVGGTTDEMTQRVSENLKDKRDRIEGLFIDGKGNHGKTLWDLYNGATEYVDHFAIAGLENSAERRSKSAMFGTGAVLKAKALELAVGML